MRLLYFPSHLQLGYDSICNTPNNILYSQMNEFSCLGEYQREVYVLYCAQTEYSACHGLINQSKMSSSKKNWPVKGLCGMCFISLKASRLLGFCLGWSSNFVGSESGQIPVVKLLNMVYNRTQYTPSPPSHTLYVYTVLWLTEGGGESWIREKVRGATPQQFTKLGRKYCTNMTDCIPII